MAAQHPTPLTGRCDLTELPRVMCAHCLGHEEQQPDRPGQLGAAFAAQFHGRCGCGDPIEPGDQIRADGFGGYLAACCWQDA